MNDIKCLVTGSNGFIGSYLLDLLIKKGYTVTGIAHRKSSKLIPILSNITVYTCDILDKEKLEEIVRKVKPDFVFHLAAQSSILLSWKEPEKTLQTNILGTLYLLESIRKADIDPLIEIACSSAEYGLVNKNNVPIKEDCGFKPLNPYAVSKIGQDMLAYLYWRVYKMRIIRIRPFYVIGPGKTFDAPSDFARGIVEIERGQRTVLNVGNLESVRDVVDVRDCVKAIWLLAERGEYGEAYNICSGKGYKIGEILNIMLSFSQKKIEIRQDPAKMRTFDEPIVIGDNSKLRKIGWRPQIPLDKTLSDILDFWRENLDRV
jgi:GDP-4-dehydro-6-deoxy-D-mannose reductase